MVPNYQNEVQGKFHSSLESKKVPFSSFHNTKHESEGQTQELAMDAFFSHPRHRSNIAYIQLMLLQLLLAEEQQ